MHGRGRDDLGPRRPRFLLYLSLPRQSCSQQSRRADVPHDEVEPRDLRGRAPGRRRCPSFQTRESADPTVDRITGRSIPRFLVKTQSNSWMDHSSVLSGARWSIFSAGKQMTGATCASGSWENRRPQPYREDIHSCHVDERMVPLLPHHCWGWGDSTLATVGRFEQWAVPRYSRVLELRGTTQFEPTDAWNLKGGGRERE